MTFRSRAPRAPRAAAPGACGAAMLLVAATVACGGDDRPPPPPVAWPVNVSARNGNQMETAVAVHPADQDRIVVASNSNVGEPPGLFVAETRDGGREWGRRIIAAGGDDGLPAACCDPRLTWDAYGNLFLVYLTFSLPGDGSGCGLGRASVVVAWSTDAGRSFSGHERVAEGCIDQPKIASGPGPDGAGSVWVAYRGDGRIVTRGAPVRGLGKVGSLAAAPAQVLPDSKGGNFVAVAVGPRGEALVAYPRRRQPCRGCAPTTVIQAHSDPDGLGPEPFSDVVAATTTRVSNKEILPAQPLRGTDAQPNLAFDRSGGPFRGRAYLSYVERGEGHALEVLLRTSTDGGRSWSDPVAVAPDDKPSTQLLPALAVDDVTGRVGVSYYDTVLDPGKGPSDTDTEPATDTHRFLTVSADGGVKFNAPQRLSKGSSNATYAGGYMNYGDYAGMAFAGGLAVVAWADNSGTTGDNPDGSHDTLDVYVSAVRSGG